MNTHQLARIGEKNFFHELDLHHVYKVGIKRFWAQEAEMSLTPMSSLESARRKFFMNSTYIMSRKKESNVFGLRRPNWVKQPIPRSNRRQENFPWTRRTSCLESRNQTFLGSGGRNESNTHRLAEPTRRKFFMNSTYIMSRKKNFKRFWAQEGELSQTANTSLESATGKFSMNSTYIMSRKQESNVFGLRRPKWV